MSATPTTTPRTDTLFIDLFGCEEEDYTPNQKRALGFTRQIETELIAAAATIVELAEKSFTSEVKASSLQQECSSYRVESHRLAEKLLESEASAAAMRSELVNLRDIIDTALTDSTGDPIYMLDEDTRAWIKAELAKAKESKAILLRLQQAEARLTNTEDLISPTDSNVQYWTQRIMDEIEESFTSQRISQVIRELLKNDTQASANENALDMFRDEFKRIKACPDVSDEVKGLCDRAIQGIESRVPLIKQIERAEAEILEYKSAILNGTATTSTSPMEA